MQLGEGEGRADERGLDARDFFSSTASLFYCVGHAIRRWSNAEPSTLPLSTAETGIECSGSSIRAGGRSMPRSRKHREIRDRDDVHPGVASGIAVGAELWSSRLAALDAGLLTASSRERGLVERLGRNA